ncbi:MAG: preprotein translocase subunit SecA [Deltaproteobacteria bacterium RBG_16_54_18]|nr:MAG: preprotein translocase subunit SecA [Deltaproteobacteria bacterium RBG_16_54_18]
MLGDVVKKVVGSKNERELKRLQPLVECIGAREPQIYPLSDHRLIAKTGEFKERLEKGEALDDLLPEVFAVGREAARRTLGERHFDVQLIGGICLHEGKIAEMATGEGKTLVSTLPAFLNALTGKGVHIVTVNDYLARRDSEWMGAIYRFLGLSVGVILHDLDDASRRKAYGADITYGTNNEFGFDYLRDNMKFSLDDYVQRELHYAIVDEVDSILVDEARTPLIISGPAEESTEKYYKINRISPQLKKERDYTIDEKSHTAVLTEEGVARVEKLLSVENLYDPIHIDTLHHVNQALRAHTLYKRDVDYVVKDGQVIIVDEFTGRLMPGRRWSEGLHQAVEAKEGVRIENENQTLATITFQNYFRMYKKLAGMTGTADTEAAEFKKTYNLDVMVIPTNRPLIRTNYADVIYKTEQEKFNAVVREIAALHEAGRPVLVGTISIDKSEHLSKLLKKRGIPHHVLNAKHHEREAEIIAQAGRFRGVTISTNMAGRGTDILLGGNARMIASQSVGKDADEAAIEAAYQKAVTATSQEREQVLQQGGLHVLGTERHESRRIDNQLRGRSGRQGDPGSSRFYLSLQDDLMRIFGAERIASIMNRLGVEEDQPIEHVLVSKAIENAQRRVEGHNFEIRKQLLEYDDVMNQQREVIYSQRREILEGGRLREMVGEMIEDTGEGIVERYTDPKLHADEWDIAGLQEVFRQHFSFPLEIDREALAGMKQTDLRDLLVTGATSFYEEKERALGSDISRDLERFILLQTLDNHWKDHLLSIDHLKEGIGLRGYAQKNPLLEYKKEGYELFVDMLAGVREEAVQKLFAVQLAEEKEVPMLPHAPGPRLVLVRGALDTPRASTPPPMVPALPEREMRAEPPPPPIRRDGQKVGRNDPCPCGSGKKYKKCCGA